MPSGYLVTIDQKLDIVTDGVKKLSTEFAASQLPFAQGATYDSRAEEHNPTCLPKTRETILARISAWADDKNGKCIFWLSGKAGTGKSTIARTVARSLGQSSRQLGATFFFKRTEADRNCADKLFTTIAVQLANSIPALQPSISQAVGHDLLISQKALATQFKELILRPIQGVSANSTSTNLIIIVIDALDECKSEDDIGTILALFNHWRDLNPISLRLFITSRPDLPIRIGFEEMSVELYRTEALHDVPAAEIKHDLNLFLQYQFEKIRLARRLPTDWPSSEEMERLLVLSFPLFISAATASRYVADRRDNPRRKLQRYLEGSATGSASSLRDIYLPILNQLLDDDKTENMVRLAEFQDVVGTIVSLETPLSMHSLSKLTRVPVDDIETRLDNLHSVLDVPTDPAKPVRTFHLSFRDFLLSEEHRGGHPFFVDSKRRHCWIANKCLQLLQEDGNLKQDVCNLAFPGIKRTEISQSDIDRCLPAHVQYACRYWFYHLARGQTAIDDKHPLLGFFQTHLLHWLEAMGLLGLLSACYTMITDVEPVLAVS